jgi:methionine sulfoxide reductase heme-binding subunit
MAESTVPRWPDEQLAMNNYQPTPNAGLDSYGLNLSPQPDLPPAPAPSPGPGRSAGSAKDKPAHDAKPQKAKSGLDAWMDADFKFGGSRIKRKTVALILLGAPAVLPLFFMLPALLSLNSSTFSVSVDDTLGTGAEICLFLCLLISPLVTLTGQRWFFPLRRWFGIMMAFTGIGDAAAASITDNFAGGVIGRLTGHIFELMGTFMVMLLIPLLITGNPWAQKKLGRYWKTLHKLIYVVWGLLALHLMLLEGLGSQSGSNGSGFPGDGDAVFHQRFYQYSACSVFLLTLRLPPVKKWIAAQQKEGRNWLVYLAILPIFTLFMFGFSFIINEEFFKGIDSFRNTPSGE